ncbi:acetylornithine deacetylase [Endozoicomonadaceae bacterium StTr2]
MNSNSGDVFKYYLSKLIETPSISCTDKKLDLSNKPVINLLATAFEEMGFHCDISPVNGEEGKFNLIATLGTGPGGLVLAGHTDTVPYDLNRWQHDPFKLTEQDNRFYGLGTCDMKGFFALVLEAVKPFIGKPLKQPIIVLATADEETTMSGARALAEAGKPKGRYALVGEPTGMRPVHMHKGIMLERLQITGKSGHSSNPALGLNAMEGMHEAMGELLKLRGELQQRYQNPGFSVPVPTINLGCIHGGDNPNRICGQCMLEYDVRMMPGMEAEAVRQEMRQRIAPLIESRGMQFDLYPVSESVEAFHSDINGELVQTCARLTGYDPESVAFATEAPFINQLCGETVVLGPGDIDQAHQPDEYLSLDRIDPMISLLRELMKRFCLE